MHFTVMNDFQIRCLKFCSLYGLIIFHFTHPLLHHHHHHHIAMQELGHFLTHSGLTHPEVSSLAFLGSFCLLGRSFSQSTPVQGLKVATLPLDLPCFGTVTHSGDISITGKTHNKKPVIAKLLSITNID
jgi:hypothetical protein